MKKIYSLFMALSFVLCAMANSPFVAENLLNLAKAKNQFAPVEKTAKVARLNKQDARQAMVEARQAKAATPMAINGVRQIEAVPTIAKQAMPANAVRKAPAKAATEATDTVEIVATTWVWKYYESDNDWYTTLIDATETYDIKLDYVSDTQAGTFTEADCIMDYTGMYIYDEEGNRSIVTFTEVDIVVTDDENGLTLHAELLGTDNVLYVVDAFIAPLPEPKATVNMAYANAELLDATVTSSAFQFSALENNYYTSIFIYSDQVEGEYETIDMYDPYYNYIAHFTATDTTFIDFLDLHAVVTKEGKTYNLVADVLGSDTIMYHITMSYTKPDPEATDTVQVVFDELASAEYYSSSADYYIYNKNENYIVTLDIFEEKGNLMGEYSVEDFDLSYTQLGVIDGDTTVVTIADAKAVVTPVEEGIVLIEAELVGMDAVLYKVSTKADVSNKGLQYDATEGFLVDEYTTEDLYTINDQSANGYIMFDVESADGNDLMGLVFWVDGADENTIIPTGTYPINDSGEAGTVLASTGYGASGLTYSLYATLDEEGYINIPCWFMVGGEVVVSEENGILSITVDAINSNNLPIFITCEYDLSTKQGLQYDMTEGSLNVVYTDNDNVEIITDDIDAGILYLDLIAADGSNNTTVAFFAEAVDPVIGIPAGTYPINDSQDYGTVLSNSGIQGGYIYPSYYINLTAQGGISIPCYFMVGGQVVVENIEGHLKVTIDALNSYDVPAHIVYEANPVETAIENVTVNTNASKMIENDQLLIIKDGVKYNVMGSVVK